MYIIYDVFIKYDVCILYTFIIVTLGNYTVYDHISVYDV